jgi:hypothetical protein
MGHSGSSQGAGNKNRFTGGFRGRYILYLVGTSSPAVNSNFQGNSLLLNGCSSTSVSFEMSSIVNVSDGTFKFGNSTIRNKKTCTGDIDNLFITALQGVDGFTKFDLGFYLTKAGTKVIECMGPIQMPRPAPVPSFIPNISQSMYQISLADSTIPSSMGIVGSKGIGVMGCNFWAVLAQADASSSFKFQSMSNVSNNTCTTDNDQKIL